MLSKIKLSTILLVLISLLASCGADGADAEKSKAKALQAKLDSLQTLHDRDEKKVERYMYAINEIQTSLSEIKQQEKILVSRASGTEELTPSDVELINSDLRTIRDLMAQNKTKLSELRKQLSRSGSKMQHFKTTIEQLNIQLNEKDTEIRELSSIIEQKDIDLQKLSMELNNLSQKISSLEQETQQKDEIIEEQQQELNTAYYVVGSKSFLKKNKIVTKAGGFIGIGSIQKIQKDNENFTQIDISQVTKIELNEVSKITLLTDHPADSYSTSKNEDGKIISLDISDAQAFWDKSKYLVIMTK